MPCTRSTPSPLTLARKRDGEKISREMDSLVAVERSRTRPPQARRRLSMSFSPPDTRARALNEMPSVLAERVSMPSVKRRVAASLPSGISFTAAASAEKSVPPS